MAYKILYDNPNEALLTRLLKVRKVEDTIEDFLNPRFSKYRIDPRKLATMHEAVDRVVAALKNKERIMIFADYDVDGTTSGFLLYTLIKTFFGHPNVSIMFPNRLEDGYGLKCHHLDTMKSKGVDLVITVDNGITSVQEALYAKKIGLDLVITDHHHCLETIPDAIAVVNPQVSPDYRFKGICGAGVAFKLAMALVEKSTFPQEKKREIFQYFLPVVAIATVADCVPLLDENRLFVKEGLELINSGAQIPPSLRGFLDHLKIKDSLSTFHIGYMIGPRINAGGRIVSPYESLNALLYSGDKQLEYLNKLESINDERKKLQDSALKKAEQMVNAEDFLIHAFSPDFHEGVIGIVAGRLTEKHYKPSIVLSISEEKGTAVASLRGPEYFSVITMIQAHEHLLERFGGHKQAGGLTVKLENLDALIEALKTYCAAHIKPQDLERTMTIDTKLHAHELDESLLRQVSQLEPFGQGNEEPLFLLEDVLVRGIEKIGSRGNGHAKLHAQLGEKKFETLFWGKGAELNTFSTGEGKNLIGRFKKDTYKGGFYVEGVEMVERENQI